MCSRISCIKIVLAFLAALAVSPFALAASVHFQTNTPGLFNQSNVLQVAMPLINIGDATAVSVRVSSATLAGAATQSSLPLNLGNIDSNKDAVFEGSFPSGSLSQGTAYLLTVKGTYQLAGKTYGFSVNRQIKLPPPPEGSVSLAEVRLDPTESCPNFPLCTPGPDTVFIPNEVNEEGPPVPTGPFNPPASISNPTFMPQDAGLGGSGGIVFNQTTPNAPNPNSLFSGIPPDMSGASSTTCVGDLAPVCTNLVLMTGNTFLAWSTDGGATFPNAQIVRPGNVYSDTPDGGFCCDQIVQYVPSINRYIWLIQTRRASVGTGSNNGPNRLRIALASPQAIISSGAKAWTYYDLTSATFGIGNNWLDYPDMAVGNNYLYVSVDQVSTGLIVARLPLASLAAGANVAIGFTDPAKGAIPYGAHLSQNALDGVYWAGHNNTSSLRVYRMPEAGNQYFWQSVNINSWSKSNYATTAPDGLDWLAFVFPRPSVMGAVRRGAGNGNNNDLWLAWGAGKDNNFAQSHIELVRLTRNGDGSVAFASQAQIWNGNLAFAYPSLATDSGGHLALAVSWGGGPSNTYGSSAVGFWGDFIVYYIDQSNLTAAYDVYKNGNYVGNQPRWGDYITVRPAANPNAPFEFSAFGYAVKQDPANRDGCNTVAGVSTGCKFAPQYFRFEWQSPVP